MRVSVLVVLLAIVSCTLLACQSPPLVTVGGRVSSALLSQCISTALAAPPPAAAVGYTCAIFDSTFTSLANVDVNDTRAAGYQWYVHNSWPGNPCWSSVLAATDFSIRGGNLVYEGDAHNQGDCFGPQTAAYTSGANYVGKTFTPGFYVDVYASYPGTTPNGTNGWPTFWAWPIEDMLGILSAGTYFTEIDFFEAISAGIGSPPNTRGSEHEWKEPQNTSGYQVSNTNSEISVTQDGALHHYGVLVGALTDNGGTGRLYRYFDNNPLASNQCTYSPTALPSCPSDGAHAGSFSEIDSMHYNIILGAGTNWGATFHEVTVYCSPSTGSCHQ